MGTGWSAAGLTRPKPRVQGSLFSMHGDLNSPQTRLPFTFLDINMAISNMDCKSCPCSKTKIG